MIIVIASIGSIGLILAFGLQVWIVSELKEIRKVNQSLVELAIVRNKINLQSNGISLSQRS